MLIDETTFVVTDTETTGLRPGPHRVTEIGAVKIEGGQITDSFSRLVNPGSPIPRQIRRLTGITTQMVAAAPPASEVLPDYLEFLGDGIFVGHNAAFDKKFLQHELREASIDFRIGSALCTRRMALRILHALPSKSLSSLMRHYGITAKRRHRALDDARATAEVLLRLMAALRNETGVDSVEELLRFQYSRHEKHRTVPVNVRRIREDRLRMLPEVSGVYLFKDAGRQILYVGKARNIRSRVRSYFVGIDTHPLRIRRLVKLIRDIDFIPTPSELSALILESRLIKTHRPRFNRAEVRYRNLPFIRIEPTDTLNSISWTFEIHADGAAYHGPLRNKNEANVLIRIARRYPNLFSSGPESVQKNLEQDMRAAADRLDFERAGVIRDQIELLASFAARPYGIGFSVLEHNAVWIQRSETGSDSTILVIRRGRLAADLTVPLPASEDDVAAIRDAVALSFDEREEPTSAYRRKEIDEIRVIASWIYRSRDHLEVVPFRPGQTIEDLSVEVETLIRRPV